jgi:hypothetical protein
MLGRRHDKRFRLTEPGEGTLRIFRDVIAQQNGDHEWIAISREPAVPGETLVLDVFDTDEGELQGRFTVGVIESRPVILDGDVQHRIRLYTGAALMPVRCEQQIRRG